MTAARTRRLLITIVWAVGTVVLWPMWYALSQMVPRPVVDGLHTPQPVLGGTPVLTGQTVLVAIVLSVSGFVFGLVGLWVMRRLGAPRLMWVFATVASIQLAVSRAIYWSRCGGPSITYLAMIFVMPALALALGAWLGSRDRGVYLTSVSSRTPDATMT